MKDNNRKLDLYTGGKGGSDVLRCYKLAPAIRVLYIMSESEKEDGIIQVLATRFETQRLPKALELKEKVEAGERLNDLDLAFLEEMIGDAARIKPMIDRKPDWQKVFAQATELFSEITSKARENEEQ